MAEKDNFDSYLKEIQSFTSELLIPNEDLLEEKSSVPEKVLKKICFVGLCFVVRLYTSLVCTRRGFKKTLLRRTYDDEVIYVRTNVSYRTTTTIDIVRRTICICAHDS